jgi:hypothetical protein
VWELFQDLDGFRLDEYKQMDDGGEGMARLLRYFEVSLAAKGGKCFRISDTRFEVQQDGKSTVFITTDREAAKDDEQLSLLGLEHPLVKQFITEDCQLEGNKRAFVALSPRSDTNGILTVWHVALQDANDRSVQKIIPLGLDSRGERSKQIEFLVNALERLQPGAKSVSDIDKRAQLVRTVLPDMLRRELLYKGLLSESVNLSWRLLTWIEFN